MKNGNNQVYKTGYPDFVVESGLQNRLIPILRIETLDGEYVGHIHSNYINERHGTFRIGMNNIRSMRLMNVDFINLTPFVWTLILLRQG